MPMRFDRRLITHFEWLMPLLALGVCGLGAITVYSATHTPGADGPSTLAVRQLTWMAGGVVVMLLALTFDYRQLDRSAYVLYAIMLLALFAVPLFGRVGGGARRWITFGPVSLQPSEFMKVVIIVVMAHYFARTRSAKLGPKDAFLPLALTALPAGAILVQPDLGSAAMVVIVALTMLVLGGVRLRWFLLAAAPLVLLSPVLWGHLKSYQQQRVLTFLNPDLDPLGAGYHVIQSKIAVGSGMLWGKGFLQGTQNHLNFLPEQHTDFIFSVFAEESGFVGAMILLGLYLALVLRAVLIAARARDRFGVLLVLGVAGLIFWQAVINVSMTTGLLPVVGIPLPFFSYGGSSVLSLLAAVGLVMNVSMRRYFF